MYNYFMLFAAGLIIGTWIGEFGIKVHQGKNYRIKCYDNVQYIQRHFGMLSPRIHLDGTGYYCETNDGEEIK